MRESMSKRDANAMSVRVELQADCLAGVWAYHASKEHGGTAEAHRPGRRAGDGRPPPRSATTACRSRRRAAIVPDSFTHGSSAQRVRWFKTGLQSGDIRRCDTFRAQQL